MKLLQDEEQKLMEKIDVANAMIKYGGSFVKALGNALQFADHINTAKIERAFSDYWIQYLTLSQKEKQNEIPKFK